MNLENLNHIVVQREDNGRNFAIAAFQMPTDAIRFANMERQLGGNCFVLADGRVVPDDITTSDQYFAWLDLAKTLGL